jgi:hypothetical protein
MTTRMLVLLTSYSVHNFASSKKKQYLFARLTSLPSIVLLQFLMCTIYSPVFNNCVDCHLINIPVLPSFHAQTQDCMMRTGHRPVGKGCGCAPGRPGFESPDSPMVLMLLLLKNNALGASAHGSHFNNLSCAGLEREHLH